MRGCPRQGGPAAPFCPRLTGRPRAGRGTALSRPMVTPMGAPGGNGTAPAIPALPSHSYTTYVGRPSRRHLMIHKSLLTKPEWQQSMHYSVSSHVLSPLRHSSATAIAHHAGSWPPTTDMCGVEGPTKRNRSPQSAPISSAHNTRAGRIGPVMPPSGHNRRRLLQPITPRFAQVPHRLQGIIQPC
jgi:hypothetical protein